MFGNYTQFRAGMEVEILWNGTWWHGTIRSVNANNMYLITYTGWGDNWDETVPVTSLRIPQNPAPPVNQRNPGPVTLARQAAQPSTNSPNQVPLPPIVPREPPKSTYINTNTPNGRDIVLNLLSPVVRHNHGHFTSAKHKRHHLVENTAFDQFEQQIRQRFQLNDDTTLMFRISEDLSLIEDDDDIQLIQPNETIEITITSPLPFSQRGFTPPREPHPLRCGMSVNSYSYVKYIKSTLPTKT